MNHRSVEHPPGSDEEASVDFTLTADQQAFRERVRSWLKANIPPEWKALGSTEVPRAEAYEFIRTWQGKLHAGGFIGVTWPKEYGGQGLTFVEEMILHEEMALQKAPPILNILGVGMAGPTIIAYGTGSRSSGTPRRSCPARRSGARATPSRTRAPTWPRCRRGR
jgi:alkylation response protein AidB-like acyl-CoA dehydrogenase